MKLRLFNMYTSGTSGTSCLALLSEHDTFRWIGELVLNVDAMVLQINRCHKALAVPNRTSEPYHAMVEAGGCVTALETVHIIGDFKDINELTQWVQMQYLMDDVSHETFKTITKESV
ncbi:membrane lipoprotein [Vibrio phage 1.152.O._10N.222.46.E1]|uniref:Membrane lipoprotein n=4 Tax=Nahantvirus 49C7 TaxID=2846601 RepID=A0A2I7RBI8_9CAUD|nr:membrane lipoprotein [Vibrio phage 1.025.O._10N.222.46.B6]AUR90839.1 membrane lipoprotein [Vibrio phage 1.150.O._10N.222.46.A6]AUR91012.1 membrane lipoprotein [Vibrio phage 1.152.O._10N.222.46.E1]AUS02480.1 membrane lipoprotein [Vibrio phage 2.130.O._10N.222.46.C2]